MVAWAHRRKNRDVDAALHGSRTSEQTAASNLGHRSAHYPSQLGLYGDQKTGTPGDDAIVSVIGLAFFQGSSVRGAAIHRGITGWIPSTAVLACAITAQHVFCGGEIYRVKTEQGAGPGC